MNPSKLWDQSYISIGWVNIQHYSQIQALNTYVFTSFGQNIDVKTIQSLQFSIKLHIKLLEIVIIYLFSSVVVGVIEYYIIT